MNLQCRSNFFACFTGFLGDFQKINLLVSDKSFKGIEFLVFSSVCFFQWIWIVFQKRMLDLFGLFIGYGRFS